MSKRKAGDVKRVEELDVKERIKAKYENKEISQTKALIDLVYASAEEFFKTDLGIVATITINGIQRNVLLEEPLFKQWMINEYYQHFHDSPRSSAVKEAHATLQSIEEINNVIWKEIFIRVAHDDEGKVYVDSGNEAFDVIEVSKTGWQIVKGAPVKFIRSKTMRSLPSPQPRGELDELKQIFQFKEDQFILWLAFVIGCFNPRGPYPLLVLNGAQGAGKTIVSEITKSVIDPGYATLRTLPESEEDLLVMAQKNWLLAFDNISKISEHMSDALCKLSTGGGLSRRQLYTNDEESVLKAMKPVILNGIENITKRYDLADRSIVLTLPMIMSENRRTKEEIWRDFEKIKGPIMGLIYDAVSMALKNYNMIHLPQKPRMADFAKWITAAEPALGFDHGTFLTAFNNNRRLVAEEASEYDWLLSAVIEMMKKHDCVSAPASEMLKLLRKTISAQEILGDEWISAYKLKSAITRIEGALLENKIKYEYIRTRDARLHTFTKL
ncbi:hypothetical protein P4T04_06320 [Bacillus badius]|uniref:hypothetical protein n=1 Tax=Bacillus badius TaxID=1455 RepID=UPI002E1EBD7E|nr:hypothetical protein [Bacillus badius]